MRYLTLKSNIEAGLEAALQKTQPAIEKVEVTGFRSGSVIADYNIIITSSAAAVNITVSTIKSAVNTAISSGNFSGIPVNKSYTPPVQGMYFTWCF